MNEMTLAPRRSMLYMPGANPRALEKAKGLAADTLIFDLEDAVSPDAKENAREHISAALTSGSYGYREILVRINSLDSPWGEADLQCVASLLAAGCKLDGVLVPKVEQAEQVQAVCALLAEYGAVSVPVWAMIETPLGVLNSQAVAASSDRLLGLVMGTNDLSKELRVAQKPGREGFLCSLSLCVLAARAYGKVIIDGVHIQLDDDEGLQAVCLQGKDLGFDGKTLIHPKQLAIANEVFSPSEQDVLHARDLVAAWQQAEQEGKGVLVVNGRLVEELHVIEAKRLLAVEARIQSLA
jgi:citrate lyase subunit beta/citryl-CoA lyase